MSGLGIGFDFRKKFKFQRPSMKYFFKHGKFQTKNLNFRDWSGSGTAWILLVVADSNNNLLCSMGDADDDDVAVASNSAGSFAISLSPLSFGVTFCTSRRLHFLRRSPLHSSTIIQLCNDTLRTAAAADAALTLATARAEDGSPGVRRVGTQQGRHRRRLRSHRFTLKILCFRGRF